MLSSKENMPRCLKLRALQGKIKLLNEFVKKEKERVRGEREVGGRYVSERRVAPLTQQPTLGV